MIQHYPLLLHEFSKGGGWQTLAGISGVIGGGALLWKAPGWYKLLGLAALAAGSGFIYWGQQKRNEVSALISAQLLSELGVTNSAIQFDDFFLL